MHWHSKRDDEIHPKLSLVPTTGKKIYVAHLITGIFFQRKLQHQLKNFSFTPEERFLLGQPVHRF